MVRFGRFGKTFPVVGAGRARSAPFRVVPFVFAPSVEEEEEEEEEVDV